LATTLYSREEEKSMQATKDVQDFEHASTVVVYDPDNGQIVHIHHCVTSHGGQHPNEEALEKAALEFASRGKAPATKLSVLHVDPSRFKRDTYYQVDTQMRSLVEIPKHRA
jgi:hypothetical protein